MSNDSKKGYEVGYGKPPVATRFQKGTSGNPSGRPKKVSQELDPGMVLQSIDSEEIVVVEEAPRPRGRYPFDHLAHIEPNVYCLRTQPKKLALV